MHYLYYKSKRVGNEFYFITCCDVIDDGRLTVYKMKDRFCGEFEGKEEDYNPLNIDRHTRELLSYASKYLGDIVYTTKVYEKPYEAFKDVSEFLEKRIKPDNEEDIRTLCEDIIAKHQKNVDDLISQHKQLEQDIADLMDKLDM